MTVACLASMTISAACSTTGSSSGEPPASTPTSTASTPTPASTLDPGSSAEVPGATSPDTTVEVDDDYVAAMVAMCTETDERIADLPEPPEQIARDAWADEVARALAAEAERADLSIRPPDEIRLDHRSYVETTQELSDAWTALADALQEGADDIEALTSDVTELTLGRNATATTLGLDACVRSGA